MNDYTLYFSRFQAAGTGRVQAKSTPRGTLLTVKPIDDHWADFGLRDGWAILYTELIHDGWIDQGNAPQPPQTSKADELNISGGVNVDAYNFTAGNDVVGGNKITQTINITISPLPPPHEA
jgi:hypothetical protein